MLSKRFHQISRSQALARNGTQTEPRLRTNNAYFKTLHFIGAGKSWKISSFGKTRN